MKVVIKQWVPVAVWKWSGFNASDDVCGICRSQFESTCPDCVKPGKECPPVTGECSHSFHIHCIITWLKRDADKSCPMCRRPFVSDLISDADVLGASEGQELASVSFDDSMLEG